MAFAAGVLGDGASADPGDALALAALALARRFSAGATMWCVAPEWREHARHVAVEFVHPVIIGKPALAGGERRRPRPRRARCGRSSRRATCVIAVGAATDRVVARHHATSRRVGRDVDLDRGRRTSRARRRRPRPVGRRRSASAAHDGRLVFQYHVLWELTHVCLEQPGLLAAPAEVCDPVDGVCVTCSDEGRLAEVLARATARPRPSARRGHRGRRHHDRRRCRARRPAVDPRRYRDRAPG